MRVRIQVQRAQSRDPCGSKRTFKQLIAIVYCSRDLCVFSGFVMITIIIILLYYNRCVCVCVYYAPTVLHTNRPGRFCHVLCTARPHGLRCCSYYTHSPLYPTPIIIGVISTVTNFSFFPLLLISSVVCSACASDPASLFLVFTPL